MSGPAWLTDDSPIDDPDGRGERAVRFIRNLRHHEGRLAGRKFQLHEWQERIVRRIYGPNDESGRRQVRTVFILLPRANGKSSLCAALALLHLFGPERDEAGQVVAAAADREQASIVFNAAARMVRQDATLSRITRITDSVRRIAHPKSASTFKALSHEIGTKHGLSLSCLIADEVHAWPKRELWDVLTTSMGKRENPLTIAITTAGVGVHGIDYELYGYAKKVAAGEIEDASFLPILYEPPEGFDWRDEGVWHAVNPALAAGFRSLDEMRMMARRAAQVPAQLEAFKRLYLNAWSDGAAAPWLDMATYDQGAEPVDLGDLEGCPCWIGVDLSSVEDLTAVVAVFPRDDGRYTVVPHFFAPEDTLRKRQDRDQIPYLLWAEQGYLTATEGSVVDYDVVESTIIALAERHQVVEIPLDRWNSTGTTNRLLAAGLPVVRFGQGFASMSPAVKETERLILSGRLHHGGHPILRWNFQNVTIDQDPAGNVKFNKTRSAEKIDGAVAAAMAIGRATAGDTAPSWYDDTEARPEGFLAL